MLTLGNKELREVRAAPVFVSTLAFNLIMNSACKRRLARYIGTGTFAGRVTCGMFQHIATGPACLGPCVPLGVLPPFSSHSSFARRWGTSSSVMSEIILFTNFYTSVAKAM